MEDEPQRHKEMWCTSSKSRGGGEASKCPSAGERVQDTISRTTEGHSDIRRSQVRHATSWVDLETFCSVKAAQQIKPHDMIPLVQVQNG